VLIDLHTHTTVSSGCSVMSPEGLIRAARRRDLDAVCVTDHFSIEGANVTQALGREMDFPVYRAVEARTTWGDMLVFGYYRDIPEGISLQNLCWTVHEVGGLVFAAHPFHTGGGPSLILGFRERGLDLAMDWGRVPVIEELDGVETLNGNVSADHNAEAGALARRLGIPGIGGSDAHAVDMVGSAVTRFSRPIRSDTGLVAALRNGEYAPVQLWNTGEETGVGGSPLPPAGRPEGLMESKMKLVEGD
jgi:predicted metal-dependent phosphoesterase TrpH